MAADSLDLDISDIARYFLSSQLQDMTDQLVSEKILCFLILSLWQHSHYWTKAFLIHVAHVSA